MKLTGHQRRSIDPPRETVAPTFPVRKFTVAEYHQLLKVGILKSGDPYELLEGWIVPKVKRRPQECYAINVLHHALRELIADGGWFAGTQYPITFPRSEPEPSCSVIRGANRDYSQRHPRPREIELVAEVSWSSLERDRGLKTQIYATGNIAVYWIVDLVDRRVEVYTQPRGGKNPTYKTRTDYGPNDTVPVVIAGKRVGTIAVKDLLP
jgi:hypothetical protein